MEVKAETTVSPEKHTTARSSKKWIVSGVLLLAAVSVFVFKDSFQPAIKVSSAGAGSKAVLTVDLTSLATQPMARNLLVSGTIWAWDPVQVGSEINGLKVVAVKADDGDHVHKGQILAELNNSVLKAQLARQVANLLGAKAALAKAIQPNRPEDLTSLKYAYSQALANVAQEEANLARAQANLAEASENAKRYTMLASQGAVSAQDADNKSTLAKVYAADLHNSEQKVTAAKFSAQQVADRLHMGEKGGRFEDVTIARAQVAQIEASVAELQSQLAQTVIKAPCDGLIMKRDVHLGDISSTTKVMFEMVRDGRLELRAQVAESDLARVKPGQSVSIVATDPGRPKIIATVREVSPLVDQDSRLGMVRIDLPSVAGVRPGNFVKGEILVGLEDARVLPASAIVYKDNRALVYTVGADNKTQMHFVTIGERTANGEYVEIISGLSPDDKVVAKGSGFLKDGDLVNINLPSGAK